MNCKLKLHSKGFYQQILGAVTVLKFLVKLALDFPYVCLQFFPGHFYRQMYRNFLKKRSRSSSACKALKFFFFFSRILKEWSFSLQFIYFLKQPFYGNYSTLDSHTNTVISHGFAYSSRWRRKPWQGLLIIKKWFVWKSMGFCCSVPSFCLF